MALLAIEPRVPSFLGLRMTGLEAEGLVVAALVFAGVNLAWALFPEPRVTPEKPGDWSSTKEG